MMSYSENAAGQAGGSNESVEYVLSWNKANNGGIK